MNILIDLVPNEVDINGKKYEIHSDFRTSILFELLMSDDEIEDVEKVIRALELYYDILPDNIELAVEQMMWFYRCGKNIENKANGKSGASAEQIYSYDYDDDYIYAAFLNQYNVDLQDVEYLHWWKFKAMFKSLKDDNEIVKIMGYRSVDLNAIEDKKQKEFYKKMKKMYEIPISRTEKEKISTMNEILLNGGDISKIL